MEWAYGFYEGLRRYKDFMALDEMRKIIDNEVCRDIPCEYVYSPDG